MTCSKVRELIPAYSGGELEGREYKEVKNHIAVCPSCAQELMEWQNIQAVLREMGDLEFTAPPDLQANVLSRITQSDSPAEKRFGNGFIRLAINSSTRLKMGIAAAAAVLVMAASAGGLWLQNGVTVASSGDSHKSPVVHRQNQEENEPGTITGTINKEGTGTDTEQDDVKGTDSNKPAAPADQGDAAEQTGDSKNPKDPEKQDSSKPAKQQQKNPEKPSDVVLLSSEKIIHSGYIKLRVANLDSLHEAAYAIASKYEATSQIQNLGQTDSGVAKELIKFNVPSASFNKLYNDLSALGQVIDTGTTDENITERYRQTMVQLYDLKAQRQELDKDSTEYKELSGKITILEAQLRDWDQAAGIGVVALWLEGPGT